MSAREPKFWYAQDYKDAPYHLFDGHRAQDEPVCRTSWYGIRYPYRLTCDEQDFVTLGLRKCKLCARIEAARWRKFREGADDAS